MHDLTPITALGGQSARVDEIGGAKLAENVNLSLASVHARLGSEKKAQVALKSLIGKAVPAIGKATFAEPFCAIWTGADQWLLCAPYETHEEMAAQLVTDFGGSASITEQSDAWAAFDLSGAGITDVMELMCPINTRASQVGDATRTSIHHLGCFVVHMPEQQGFRIFAPRASAGSVHHAIVTAMRSAL